MAYLIVHYAFYFSRRSHRRLDFFLGFCWKSEEASCTVVPKLSTKNGLVYLYTREYGNGIPKSTVAWYFTAIDFRTGKTVFKVHTGNRINWNNSYGPITIGPDGTAYVGVFNGIISVKDAK